VWAPNWPAPRVRAAVRTLLDADTALKGTTLSDERGILLDVTMRLTT
jgi:hypothetical protein